VAYLIRESRSAICIISENEPVPPDQRVWQEASALRDAGYRVSVICPKGPGCESGRETIEEIDIYRHSTWKGGGRGGYVLEYFFALIAEFYLATKVYARTRFRILLGCNPPDTIFLIALVFKIFGVRFVFDHHDLSPELYDAKFIHRGLIYKVVCLAERLTFRFADMTIATNESYKEIAIARGRMNPAHVVVVQTCADLAEVRRAQAIRELKRNKRYLVAYVGVMEIQDGVELLLESIRYIVKFRKREDTHFVIIGMGNELARLKKLTMQFDLEAFVEFTGWISHEQVGSYLSTADVCVAPDPLNPLNDKSTMIKILEYMAYSCPVVLYDLAEGRRTLGDAGLYARPDDPIDFAVQIEKLLDSEQLRNTLGEHGRQKTEEGLNWEMQGAKLVQSFHHLLDPNFQKQ
jgi:glycosyltransferase involved in cell wall biosynthesis